MPKRVVHGEGVWRSEKLARVEPPTSRAEYANLIPLALSNGVFECNAKRVWSDVYAFNRPDMPLEGVECLLNEFERVKLLFRWTDSEGKTWGFWIGIDKPGRLPGRSRRGKNEPVGPEPPQDELRKFLDSNGFHRALNGNEKLLGFGSGFGSGSGKDILSKPKNGSDGSLFDSKNQQSQPSTSGQSKKEFLDAAVRGAWDYYIHTMRKNPKLLTLTTLRKQKGLARLRECLAKTGGDLGKAEELMKIAIDTCAASDYHQGANDKKRRYNSWEGNLFPSQEKLEWWLDGART